MYMGVKSWVDFELETYFLVFEKKKTRKIKLNQEAGNAAIYC